MNSIRVTTHIILGGFMVVTPWLYQGVGIIGAVALGFASLIGLDFLVFQPLVRQMNLLREVDKAKSEFLSIVSHELRTPLTSIKGSLGILRSGALGPVGESSMRMLEIADIETERLIYLINELLDLAKIEARQLSLQQNWMCLTSDLKETADSLIGLTHPRGLNITLKTDDPLEIYADRLRLKQIVQNLLSNAIKHSPDGGHIELATRIQDDQVRIDVRDHGPGIAEKDLHRIFEKFTQASHPSITTQGTGLGLTIARELVHLHGGSIHVESELGKGANFYILMPRWRPVEAAKEQDKAA